MGALEFNESKQKSHEIEDSPSNIYETRAGQSLGTRKKEFDFSLLGKLFCEKTWILPLLVSEYYGKAFHRCRYYPEL